MVVLFLTIVATVGGCRHPRLPLYLRSDSAIGVSTPQISKVDVDLHDGMNI